MEQNWEQLLEDYISRLNYIVMVPEGKQNFEMVKNNKKAGRNISNAKIEKNLNILKDKICQNNWLTPMVHGFLEIIPEILDTIDELEDESETKKSEYLRNLLNQAFKVTINVWKVFYKTMKSLAEIERGTDIYDKFLTHGLIDFSRITQLILYIEPPSVILEKPTLPTILRKNLAKIFSSVTTTEFFDSFKISMTRQGDYWSGQTKRDLMNQSRAIPM